jgi:hypothetical protein
VGILFALNALIACGGGGGGDGVLSTGINAKTNMMGFSNQQQIPYSSNSKPTVYATVATTDNIPDYNDQQKDANTQYWKLTLITNKGPAIAYFRISGIDGSVVEAVRFDSPYPADGGIAFVANSPIKLIDFNAPVGTTWSFAGSISTYLKSYPIQFSNYNLASALQLTILQKGFSYTLPGGKVYNDCISVRLELGNSMDIYFSKNNGIVYIQNYSNFPRFPSVTFMGTSTATTAVATPSFDAFLGPITITCATSGADIYYTTDGSSPTASSTKYTGAIAIPSSSAWIIKAIAIKPGMLDSKINTMYGSNGITVYPPRFNLPTGTYTSVQSVTITCDTSGADIYYTVICREKWPGFGNGGCPLSVDMIKV